MAADAAGKSALAQREFRAIVKIDPTNKYGWYDLGVIAQMTAAPAEAAADYSKAIAIDPKFESALYNLGELRAQAHDLPGAIAYLRLAVAASPADANAVWNLAVELSLTGDPANVAEAKTLLTRALKLNPGLSKQLSSSAK